MYAAQFVTALVVSYAAAMGVWPLLGLRGLAGWLRMILCIAPLLTPLFIAPQQVILRALVSLLAMDLFFRTTDYSRQWRMSAHKPCRFVSFVRFLTPIPFFLSSFGENTREPRLDLSGCYSTGLALISVALTCGFLMVTSHMTLLRSSFLIDHTIKFAVFPLAITAIVSTVYGLERIAGFKTRPLMDHPFRSLTVGDFWYRYNSRVQSWFSRNVVAPSGGRRAVPRAVVLAFLVSAVLHELMFDIATSRIDGYQLAFFLLQVPAVLLGRATERVVRKHAVGRVFLHIATVIWLWSTSMLFFRGVDRVFPLFYVSDPWLP